MFDLWLVAVRGFVGRAMPCAGRQIDAEKTESSRGYLAMSMRKDRHAQNTTSKNGRVGIATVRYIIENGGRKPCRTVARDGEWSPGHARDLKEWSAWRRRERRSATPIAMMQRRRQ